ncbi:MAG TPA: hypothetical protein VLJ68_10780, partial [Chitinophagaceae bacterium]|nr:hypothetical protein [Chitinophagaceae bacterium]
MRWRKFNGDPIEIPILDAVESAVKREIEKGYRLKVCIGTAIPPCPSGMQQAEIVFPDRRRSG